MADMAITVRLRGEGEIQRLRELQQHFGRYGRERLPPLAVTMRLAMDLAHASIDMSEAPQGAEDES